MLCPFCGTSIASFPGYSEIQLDPYFGLANSPKLQEQMCRHVISCALTLANSNHWDVSDLLPKPTYNIFTLPELNNQHADEDPEDEDFVMNDDEEMSDDEEPITEEELSHLQQDEAHVSQLEQRGRKIITSNNNNSTQTDSNHHVNDAEQNSKTTQRTEEPLFDLSIQFKFMNGLELNGEFNSQSDTLKTLVEWTPHDLVRRRLEYYQHHHFGTPLFIGTTRVRD
nr:unnamed protein product [Naegleria fowleri]